jgi:hypothetical protein
MHPSFRSQDVQTNSWRMRISSLTRAHLHTIIHSSFIQQQFQLLASLCGNDIVNESTDLEGMKRKRNISRHCGNADVFSHLIFDCDSIWICSIVIHTKVTKTKKCQNVVEGILSMIVDGHFRDLPATYDELKSKILKKKHASFAGLIQMHH